MRSIIGLAALFFLLPFAFAAPPEPKLALKGLDPIALVEGREVNGLESIEATHGLFKYRFSTAENKKAFEAKPEERGIQFGGACGKMGPFSGTGNPERWFVHDKKIYVFASESCREGFKKNPALHIELPNLVPEGTVDQKKRGAELLDLALKGFGGADKVDGLKTLEKIETYVYKQGNQESTSKHRIIWQFPDRVRIEEEFSKAYGSAINGAKGFQFAGDESWPLDSAMRDLAWRQALRQPLAMLRNRTHKNFVAVANGKGVAGGGVVGKVPSNALEVEFLAVALDGASSTWSIEPKSGRIYEVKFEAQHGTVGDNVMSFDDFREVNGLTLPHKRTRSFNGTAIASPGVRLEKFAINGELKAGLFDLPK